MNNLLPSSNGLIRRVCGECRHEAAPAPAKAVPWAAELCLGARAGSSCQNEKAFKADSVLAQLQPLTVPPLLNGMFPLPPDLPLSLPSPFLQAAAFEQTPSFYFSFKDPSSSC